MSKLNKLRINLNFPKHKSPFLTIKEKREIMLKDEPMPTAMFRAKKKVYFVKSRGTIFHEYKK